MRARILEDTKVGWQGRESGLRGIPQNPTPLTTLGYPETS